MTITTGLIIVELVGITTLAGVLYHCGDARIEDRPPFAVKIVTFANAICIGTAFVAAAHLLGGI